MFCQRDECGHFFFLHQTSQSNSRLYRELSVKDSTRIRDLEQQLALYRKFYDTATSHPAHVNHVSHAGATAGHATAGVGAIAAGASAAGASASAGGATADRSHSISQTPDAHRSLRETLDGLCASLSPTALLHTAAGSGSGSFGFGVGVASAAADRRPSASDVYFAPHLPAGGARIVRPLQVRHVRTMFFSPCHFFFFFFFFCVAIM